jgi:hypothetical protein
MCWGIPQSQSLLTCTRMYCPVCNAMLLRLWSAYWQSTMTPTSRTLIHIAHFEDA